MIMIEQVVQALENEKKLGLTSRFPCRAIMVSNIAQYLQLLNALKNIPDSRLVRADELFSSADIMPKYENLQDSSYADQWLILTGVSEYLRLFGKSEAEKSRFAKLWKWQAPAASSGRILIPLWGCSAQWHDNSLHLCEDERQKPFYFDCTDENDAEQTMQVTILSGDFEQYFQQISLFEGRTLIGLEDWFEYWMAPEPEQTEFLLLTRRYANVVPTSGAVSIDVIRSTLSFIQRYLDGGSVLTGDNCPAIAVNCLFPCALQHMSVDKAILTSLNMSSFSALDAASKWKNWSDGQKQLVFLWEELYPQEDYFSYCIRKCSSYDELPDHILHDIFNASVFHPEWVEDYCHYIEAFDLEKDEEFYGQLDQIPVYEDRLGYLLGHEKSEKIYMLRMVGKWLREDRNQVENSTVLKKVFPELSAYLSEDEYDVDLARYFSLYKAHKLENSLPLDEMLYFSGFRFDSYDFRYTVLSRELKSDTLVLWIDALGAEWLPLLKWSLEHSKKGKVTGISIAQCVLPSETAFNNQWEQMTAPYEKLDKLDKLAHRGVVDEPDYYTCVAEQIDFICSIRKKIESLLSNYRRVIVTGDHGTSRLAARFFHTRPGLDAPAGSVVGSHGRFCRLPTNTGGLDHNLFRSKIPGGDEYASYMNYDHFKQSGFATSSDDENALYGEIHGGASPEEVLVPVVVFDSTQPMKLQGKWESDKIKIKKKKIRAQLNLNASVVQLSAKIGDNEAICTASPDGKVWYLDFFNVKKGSYDIAVLADGSMLQMSPLELVSPLGDDDDLL